MAWPKLLVLVRHGESEGNLKSVDGRALFDQATHAYPLTERGRRQAEITGEFLKCEYDRFDIRYTSYYARARETMSLLVPGEKFYVDPRLAEAQRGIYHSMTHTQLEARFPEELVRRDREGLYHYRPLGGENWPDVELRIHSFLGTLSRDCGGDKVMIVVHGHWLVLFQRLIHHFSIEDAVIRYHQRLAANCSVTVYRGRRAGLIGRSRLELVLDKHVPWQRIIPG